MHCKQWESLLAGTKTEIRRPREVGDVAYVDGPRIQWVYSRITGEVVYRVGDRYPIEPGRRRRPVGSLVLHAIRLQSITGITDEEIAREGFPHAAAFWAAWNAEEQHLGFVWVLTIGDVQCSIPK